MLKKLIGVIVAAVLVLTIIPIITPNHVSEETPLVYIIAGQSNAAAGFYDVDVVNEELPAPSKPIWYYGTDSEIVFFDNGSYNPSDYDFHQMYQNGEYIVGNIDAPIAATLTQSGHEIITINVGVPGKSIYSLIHDEDCTTFISTILDDALRKISEKWPNASLQGVIWSQGEGDLNTPIPTYMERFSEGIMPYYEGLGFNSFYIIQTRNVNSLNANIAQSELAVTYSNVFLASTIPSTLTPGEMIDSWHYTQHTDDEIGVEVGKCIIANSPIGEEDLTDKLLGLIPLLFIVGLLVAAMGLVIIRRNAD